MVRKAATYRKTNWGYLLATLFLCLSFLTACNSNDDFDFADEGTSGSDTSAPVGNSAITFTPSSHDFGAAAITTGTANQLINLENTSTSTVFIDNFSGTTSDFTILTNNCPTGSSGFDPGQNCQMTLQFSPQTAGNLSTTLIVEYGDQVGEDDLNSLLGLSGTGVGSLTFAGISSVDNVEHNSMRLNWAAEAGAVSFFIYRVVGGSLNFVSTVVNSGGTVTSFDATGLDPNTSYTWRVRAVDALGNQDANTADITQSTDVNLAPVLNAIAAPNFYSGETVTTVNAGDSLPAAPEDDFDQDGDSITYTCFYDNFANGSVATTNTCGSLTNEGGGNPTFSSATGGFSGWIPQNAQIGTDFEFMIVGTDTYGSTDSVIFAGTIVAGTPATPVVTSVSPAGPANNNSPTVNGTGEVGMTLNLFSNSGCSTQIGTGTVDGSGNWAVTATVTDDTTTTIFAQAQNVIGNDSPCSATSQSYVEDSTGPSIFVLSTNPSTTGNIINPTVTGLTEGSASVEIFSDAFCSTSLATGTADGGGSYTIAASVPLDATTTFYAEGTDAAGNTGNCSTTTQSYIHYTIADNIGYFTGTQTVTSGTTFNPDSTDQIQWSAGQFDANYFSHSTSSNSHQITVQEDGDYFFSLTLPLQMGSGNFRPTVQAEILVNGTAVSGAIGESSYIRDDSGHTESSDHIAVMAPGLSSGDIVTVNVLETSSQDGTEVVNVTNRATLYAEYYDQATRNYFSGTATQTTNSTNLNQTTAFALEWTQTASGNGGFTHSAGSENIDLDNGGQYMVYVNIPVNTSSARASARIQVQVEGTTVAGGIGQQGYMRADSGHNDASVHWSGMIGGISGGDTLTILVDRVSEAGTVTVQGGKTASIFIEEIDTSSKIISATGTRLVSGTNWNPGTASPVQWSALNDSVDDNTVYTHDTSSNSHQITINEAGDYLVVFNASYTSAVQRANPKNRLLLDGSAVSGAETKSSYIRNNSAHSNASNSLVYLLRDVSAGQVLTVTSEAEATTGTVDDDDFGVLTVIQK